MADNNGAMICKKCQQRQATIHSLELVEGQWMELHLCEECAFGAQPQESAQAKIQIIGKIIAQVGAARDAVESDTTCPGCGMTLERFRELRRLGCARCYRTFRSLVEETLESVHEDRVHRGKVPERPANAPPSPMRIRRLQEKLARAIDDERFEEAALFRDEIRKLQEQLDRSRQD